MKRPLEGNIESSSSNCVRLTDSVRKNLLNLVGNEKRVKEESDSLLQHVMFVFSHYPNDKVLMEQTIKLLPSVRPSQLNGCSGQLLYLLHEYKVVNLEEIAKQEDFIVYFDDLSPEACALFSQLKLSKPVGELFVLYLLYNEKYDILTKSLISRCSTSSLLGFLQTKSINRPKPVQCFSWIGEALGSRLLEFLFDGLSSKELNIGKVTCFLRKIENGDIHLRKCFAKGLNDLNETVVLNALQVAFEMIKEIQSYLTKLVNSVLSNEKQELLMDCLLKFEEVRKLEVLSLAVHQWIREDKITKQNALKFTQYVQSKNELVNVEKEIRAIVDEFEQNGFIIPSSLIARKKTWTKNVFIPNLLKPSAQKKEVRERLITEFVNLGWITKNDRDNYNRLCNAVILEKFDNQDMIDLINEFIIGNDVKQIMSDSKHLSEIVHVLLERVFLDPSNSILCQQLASFLVMNERVFDLAKESFEFAFADANSELEPSHLVGLSSLLVYMCASKEKEVVELLTSSFKMNEMREWLLNVRMCLFFWKQCEEQGASLPEPIRKQLSFGYLRVRFLSHSVVEEMIMKVFQNEDPLSFISFSEWIEFECQHMISAQFDALLYYQHCISLFKKLPPLIEMIQGLKKGALSPMLCQSIREEMSFQKDIDFFGVLEKCHEFPSFSIVVLLPLMKDTELDVKRFSLYLNEHVRDKEDWMNDSTLFRFILRSIQDTDVDKFIAEVPHMLSSVLRFYKTFKFFVRQSKYDKLKCDFDTFFSEGTFAFDLPEFVLGQLLFEEIVFRYDQSIEAILVSRIRSLLSLPNNNTLLICSLLDRFCRALTDSATNNVMACFCENVIQLIVSEYPLSSLIFVSMRKDCMKFETKISNKYLEWVQRYYPKGCMPISFFPFFTSLLRREDLVINNTDDTSNALILESSISFQNDVVTVSLYNDKRDIYTKKEITYALQAITQHKVSLFIDNLWKTRRFKSKSVEKKLKAKKSRWL